MNNPNNPNNPIVIIYVGSGCLRGVLTNVPNLKVILADQDVHNENCERGECECDLEDIGSVYKEFEDFDAAVRDARKELVNG